MKPAAYQPQSSSQGQSTTPNTARKSDGGSSSSWWLIGIGIGVFAWFVNRRNENDATRKPEEPPRGGEPRPGSTNSPEFSCYRCKGPIRVQLVEMGVRYACPNCSARFTMQKTGSPPTFVVVPDPGDHKPSTESTECNTPTDLNTALSVLGIAGPATSDQIRSAYRELIKAYHPDKVAHLGPDLQRLAESKTKEINAAYRFLETSHGTL